MDAADGEAESFRRHLNRLINEESVKIIDEFHERPQLKKNIEISQIKWPKLGSLSFLKPMIDENKDSVIERLSPSDSGIYLNTNDFKINSK